MIDPEDLPGQNDPNAIPPSYAPRADFLISLAQEALSLTRRRKLEKEIAVITAALKDHDDKSTNRLAKQLKNRLDKLNDELRGNS